MKFHYGGMSSMFPPYYIGWQGNTQLANLSTSKETEL